MLNHIIIIHNPEFKVHNEMKAPELNVFWASYDFNYFF